MIAIVLAASGSADTVLAVVFALVAVMAYPVSTAFQQRANLNQLREDAEAGAGSATRRVLREPIWWIGNLLGFVGVIAQTVALGFGALTLVTAILVLQLVVLVPAGTWVIGGRVQRNEVVGAAFATVGLGLFLVALRPEEGVESGSGAAWLVAGLVFVSVFGLLQLGAARLVPYRAALRGAAAGVWAGFLGSLLKQLAADPVITNWALWIFPVAGILNVVWINAAIRAGRLSTAFTLIVVVGSVVGFAIGLGVFDETLAVGAAAIVAGLVGIAGLGVGIWRLARSPSLLALDEAAKSAES